jgi:hypothetical protein
MSDQAAAIASLLGEAVPHGIGAATSPDGAILRRPEVFPFSFAFHFAGWPFRAEATEQGQEVHIALSAGFGILPYTQEDRVRRAGILHVLQAMESARLGWRVTSDQQVQFVLDLPVALDATPSEIITELVATLLPLQGWFDLLAEVCAAPTPSTAMAVA